MEGVQDFEGTAPREPSDGAAAKHILVVEDDAANRRLMTEILKLNGYRTTIMASGDEAHAWLKSRYKEFDLLLTDVRMPGMSGKELAEKYRELRPNAKVLFVTGFSDFTPHELTKHPDADDSILQKPFGSNDLIRKIESLLRAR